MIKILTVIIMNNTNPLYLLDESYKNTIMGILGIINNTLMPVTASTGLTLLAKDQSTPLHEMIPQQLSSVLNSKGKIKNVIKKGVKDNIKKLLVKRIKK